MEIDNVERARLRSKVLNFLKANDIEYKLYEHPALYTVEECLAYWGNIPDVTHCKNLFFRNHKGNRHYLVSMECHKLLDIHSLEHMLRQGKLSFASEERMVRCLGLHPGSVSAFGLIEDIDPKDADPKELFPDGHRVKYYIASALRDADRVSFHPCENTASVVITNAGFRRLLSIWGGEVEWLDV